MNIIVTGASSFIGAYLCRELSRLIGTGTKINVTGLYNNHNINFDNINLIQIDITDFSELRKLFIRIKPDTVIHLASVTQTNTSRYENTYVHLVNHSATERIAELCSELNAKLIYTSTDLVYKEGIDIKEDTSPFEPVTIYAKTKLLGEEAVKQFANEYIILRLSLVVGKTISAYRTFFDEVYENLSSGKIYPAFTDQFRNSIFIKDVVENIIKVSGMELPNQAVNLCGDEFLSRYEMCMMIADVFGFNKNLIQKVSCEKFKDYKMVKQIGLNNERMKLLGLSTQSFNKNLQLIFPGIHF
jgi:dTDP-4-dehydrorhamnose reductase